jgi:squalene-hopene/tetraprenyl-beta-curcumene cyclase
MRLLLLPALALLLSFSIAAADTAEKAAKKATKFLIAQQNDDGTFGKGRETALPGLVGLTIEALAISPEKLREDNPAVAKAVKYILEKQQPSGAFAIPEFGLENYNTACASIGLKALESSEHAAALEKAKAFILSCQYAGKDEEPGHGSFAYNPGKPGDLSNTGFSVEALKELGLPEGSPAYANAVKFIKRCQDNPETNDLESMKGGAGSGGFVYVPGQSPFGTESAKGQKYVPRPYGNMTYEAVKSLIYAKVKEDDPAMQAAFKWIRQNYSVKNHPGSVSNEGYFYYAMAMAKAFTAMGVKELELADGRKVHWAKDLAEHLASIQKSDGSFANESTRWMEGNPILATTYALQALSLCHNAMK